MTRLTYVDSHACSFHWIRFPDLVQLVKPDWLLLTVCRFVALLATLIAEELKLGIIVRAQVVGFTLFFVLSLIHVTRSSMKISQFHQIQLTRLHQILNMLKLAVRPVRTEPERVILANFSVKIRLIIAFVHFGERGNVRLIEFLEEALAIILFEFDDVFDLLFLQFNFFLIFRQAGILIDQFAYLLPNKFYRRRVQSLTVITHLAKAQFKIRANKVIPLSCSDAIILAWRASSRISRG